MWQFKDVTWMQDDDAQTFKPVRLHGTDCISELVAPLAELVGAKRHKIADGGLICSQGTFPSEFSCCPYCGGELSAPEDRTLSPWIPPYGCGSGLKILPNWLKPDSMLESKGKPLTLPSIDGHFSFCSVFLGAKKRLLIALQRDIGKLSIYQPDSAKKWRDLDGKTGEDGLPEWSWSLATDVAETGLAIPGKDGPAWITIDWAKSELQIDRGEGCSIGGVIRLGRFLLAPVLRSARFSMLCRKDSDAKWFECKISHDVAIDASHMFFRKGRPAYFGIPVVDETRMIAYWPSSGGYVKVTEASIASEHVWEFRSWEKDEYPATGLVELGPPYREIGSRSGFWQLCEGYDPLRRDKIKNKIIKLDGDGHADSEDFEYGQFVSTGRASFAWLYDFWNDMHLFNAYAGEQEEIRYPLLQFGERGLVLIAKVRPWQGREDMGLFTEIFSNNREKIWVFVRLVIERVDTSEKALHAESVDGGQVPAAGSLFVVPLSQLTELSVFIYDAQLYIYFPEDNKCFGWPLEITEA